MVLVSHPELFQLRTLGPKLHVCGHYPQKSLIPFRNENLVCLDTGCGTLRDGRLTALFLPEMRFLQVDSLGRVTHC